MQHEEKKSDLILAEVRKRKEEAAISGSLEEEKLKLVIFTLSDHCYAFPGRDVKEILRYEKITPVPGSHGMILGIINVRGDIESVLNMHKLLNLPETAPTPKSRIVMAASEELRTGILVDSVEDVLDFSPGSVHPPLATLSRTVREFAMGEVMYGDRSVLLLDVSGVMKKLLSD